MIFDVVGWVGSFLVVLAYLLLSTKKLSAGMTYQLMNLVAAVCIAIGVFPKNAWFSFALQVVWGIIAVVSIVKLKMKPAKRSAK